MSDFDSSLVQCPYYVENFSKKQSRHNQIRCEGLDDTHKISLVFRSKELKQRYQIRYCFGVFTCKKCRIHSMLDDKYEVDEDE